jgi:hypothetical protein
LKKSHPVAVYNPVVFQAYALSIFAQTIGDQHRAFRELALAADAAPRDPYLARCWARAQKKKEP